MYVDLEGPYVRSPMDLDNALTRRLTSNLPGKITTWNVIAENYLQRIWDRAGDGP